MLVMFGSFAGLVDGQAAMYGCVAELFATGESLLEGNMSATDSPPQSNVQAPSRIGSFARHPKDPSWPWISAKELAVNCHELVERVDPHLWELPSGHPSLQTLVDLHDEPRGIVLVEVFAGLGT